MSKRRLLTTAIVLAILGALVYFQVLHWRSFDWHKFRLASRVNPVQIVLAIVLIYIADMLRAVRWKICLEPVRPQARARDLIGPTFIGFTGLALLGRPGEFIRPFLIAKKMNVTVSSQIGVWTVERIFDIGAFAVLMTLDVFLSNGVKSNPYIGKFQLAAVAICGLVAFMAVMAFLIRKRGPDVASFLHRAVSPISTKMADHVDQKVCAFGEGLNTVAGWKGFVKLSAISILIWFLIAVSYREVAHSYPPEPPPGTVAETEVPSLDVETARLAEMPESAGLPLDNETLEQLRPALEAKGFGLREEHGEIWLMRKHKKLKRIGDRPHLSNMDISHVLLLMGFSMVGSVVQLPAVGGGSQLAVISALQVIYGIPPELAVSCGILLWLVTFMSIIPLGLILAHREHLSLRKVEAEAEEEEKQRKHAEGGRPRLSDV